MQRDFRGRGRYATVQLASEYLVEEDKREWPLISKPHTWRLEMPLNSATTLESRCPNRSEHHWPTWLAGRVTPPSWLEIAVQVGTKNQGTGSLPRYEQKVILALFENSQYPARKAKSLCRPVYFNA